MTAIYTWGALYGPDEKEIDHPKYERRPVVITSRDGFVGTLYWHHLDGAAVSFFRLLFNEWPILESPHVPMVVGKDNTISIAIEILGDEP